jgi:ligand-binding sensor domain-containing protein
VHPENSIKFGNQEIVNKLLPLNDSKLLVSTDKGIQYFDIQNHTFTKIFNNNDSLFVTQPNDIKRNGDNIYVATNYGVYIYNISTKQITTFKNVQNNSNTIASNLIKDIHFSKSSNYLWLNVINKGIDIINLSTNKIIHLNNKNAKEYGIENENYNEIIEDNENNIWLGGIDLAKYDPNKRKFGLLAKDFPNDFNLGFSFVWGTFVDSKGHAWLGEYVPYKGIMEIDRSKNIQKRYLEDPSISYIRLWNFCEDAKGNIYAFSSSPNGIILYKKANFCGNT